MPANRLNVVVTRRLPEVVEARMKQLFNVTLRDGNHPFVWWRTSGLFFHGVKLGNPPYCLLNDG